MKIEDILRNQGELYKNLPKNETIKEGNETIKPKLVSYGGHQLLKQEYKAITELSRMLGGKPQIVDDTIKYALSDFAISIKNYQITCLKIWSSGLREIPKQVSSLTGLQVLDLFDNQIQEISSLEKLINLRILWLRKNEIKEIKSLDNLRNLEELYLADNQITEIKGLDNLQNLKTIWLDNNRITEIKGLDNLLNLKEFWITRNPIENMGEIKKLRSKKIFTVTS